MAGYSDNREHNYEVKYLRKVLGKVDEKLLVPDSVRGAALRQKLDSVAPPVPVAPNTRSGAHFGFGWLGVHSALTWAAAFVLIVGLFYGLGLHQRPEIVENRMALPQLTEARPESDADISMQVEPFASPLPADESSAAAVVEGTDQPSSTPEVQADPGSSADRPGVGGVGGGGRSSMLDSLGGFTFTWRANDAADPDKGAYPITVDIVRDTDEQLANQIDISDMIEVRESWLQDDVLTLAGPGATGVVVRTYDVSDPASPVERSVLYQPGAYVASRLYMGVVVVVGYSDELPDNEIVAETLPDAGQEGYTVISALEVAGGDTNQMAYIGAVSDISLYDLSAYITYNTESSGEEAVEQHIAQIALTGLEIGLESISS